MLSCTFCSQAFGQGHVYFARKKGLMIDLPPFGSVGGVRGHSVVLVYGVHNIPSDRQDWLSLD